jgi:hypothetical protein
VPRHRDFPYQVMKANAEPVAKRPKILKPATSQHGLNGFIVMVGEEAGETRFQS